MFRLEDDYRRNVINRNRLQGTPLYLPWMQGIAHYRRSPWHMTNSFSYL